MIFCRIRTDPNDFRELQKLASQYDVSGRGPNASLLLWFLNSVYRMDEIEAQDAVCDNQGDAGFDAMAVDEVHQEIVVFQSKRRQSLPATLGDVDLKTFVGSLQQLNTPESVEQLIKTTKNIELKSLMIDLDLVEKVRARYTIRGIFVTNVAANEDASNYIKHVNRNEKLIDVWDSNRLSPVVKQLTREWFVSQEVAIRIASEKVFSVISTEGSLNLVYAAIKARNLVALPGIDDSRIFAQNVRLGLGNTRVNDDIVASIKTKEDHKNFLTFHNGLTIVAKSISLDKDVLIIKDFSVCNGCQSLLAFYNNQSYLSDDLEVLVRFVRVGDDRRLPETIAYRTNNQNAISLRDLVSNDIRQVRIQSEFNDLFGKTLYYTIKKGEQTEIPEISNELAGRLVLALYVPEPWNTHQKYRIFGDLESKIFNYHISSAHIKLAYELFILIKNSIGLIENQRLAHYGLTHYVILFLLGQLILNSDEGKKVFEAPLTILSTDKNMNKMESKFVDQCKLMIQWLITEINYTIEELGGESYDYKREFKSQKSVLYIRDQILKAFDKDKYRGRAPLFKLE